MLIAVDLQKAFRNLQIDPVHCIVLELQWCNQKYIDVATGSVKVPQAVNYVQTELVILCVLQKYG